MTHSTRTILTAQRLGSGRMAALMTGSFGLLILGPAPNSSITGARPFSPPDPWPSCSRWPSARWP